ncbi:hypothetical protein TIFTF001_042051 [Ficus carica]|uniref:Uncharacterized protein n=1 Tax=Ficus carica TaxID=3494 RepID=A0AA88CY95_FICCA|nr:hypothetical protein TIFTF001_042034 [Ficus carica]GMN34440.1 hypothetical protein TIFTF001_042051 [Ficus carica]
MKQGKNKIKHHYDKQDAYVVSTRVRSGLVHGLSWTRLVAPTTPWQRATVSDLPAILDAILWRVGAADCEMWNGHRHGKLPRVLPIRARSGLVHDFGTQIIAGTLGGTAVKDSYGWSAKARAGDRSSSQDYEVDLATPATHLTNRQWTRERGKIECLKREK